MAINSNISHFVVIPNIGHTEIVAFVYHDQYSPYKGNTRLKESRPKPDKVTANLPTKGEGIL